MMHPYRVNLRRGSHFDGAKYALPVVGIHDDAVMDAVPAGTLETPQQRRWPGALMSFFVPGFGLIRSGNTGAGARWFLGIYLADLLVMAAVVAESMPIWGAAGMIAANLTLKVVMIWRGFKPGRMSRGLWLWFIIMLAVLVFTPSPALRIGRAMQIPTGAMQPTLMGRSPENPDCDQIFGSRLSYLFSDPERGDLIFFSTKPVPNIARITGQLPPEGTLYVKRVVGLPGEKIEIKEGSLYADGKKLGQEDGIPPIPYVLPTGLRGMRQVPIARSGEAYVVGENEYFVLGDNSANSLDSRYWGPIPEEAIMGKVTKIYYPFSRMGKPVYPSATQSH